MARTTARSGTTRPSTRSSRPADRRSERATRRPAPTRSRKPAKGRPRLGTVKPIPRIRRGLIAHTEFSSEDPPATQRFLERAFGWSFATVARPQGEYRIFKAPLRTGGGIRATEPGESPRSVPYVEFPDLAQGIRAVAEAGGKVLVPRLDLPEGQGSIVWCEGPGGITLALWAPK